MAGDWIPIRKGLKNELEVMRLSVLTGLSQRVIVSLLIDFWEWCDTVTVDGIITGVKLSEMSRLCPDAPGTFFHALSAVGWLVEFDDGIKIPNFERWLGNSAKKRLKEARRKQKYRRVEPNVPLVSREMSAGSRQKSALQKRREEYKEEPYGSSCSEPPKAASEQAESSPVLTFPSIGTGAKTWDLTSAKVVEYRAAFPGIDVLAECRAALQWCRDNPTKRKTARGMAAFLTRWLSRAQNSRGRNAQTDRLERPGRIESPPGKYDGLGERIDLDPPPPR